MFKTSGSVSFRDTTLSIGSNVTVGSSFTYMISDNVFRHMLGATTKAYILYNAACSQMYAKVAYTPSSSTVTLPLPTGFSVKHARKVNRFLFPDGSYEVDDMGRGGKELSLSGYVYGTLSDISDKAQDIADMTHYGKYVSIDNLPNDNLNTDYYIRDFSFDQEGGNPNLYSWKLSLEEA